MIKKEEVRNFVKQYTCNFIKDENVKSVETITRYISYDMELVTSDYNLINRYLMDNFGIDNINLSLDRLCVTKDNETWNKLETLEDLAILEELLGLGIVSGLIIDDFKMRIEVFLKLGNDNIYMCPELLDIQEQEQKDYMDYMKQIILPQLSFTIDESKIERKEKATYSDEEKKDLMRFWFYNINEVDVDDTTLELFNTLINDNVDRVVNAAVMLRLLKHGPETFYYNMKVDPSLLFIEALNQKVREFEYDKREYFEDVKKIFLSEIDRIKNDYNFHHKKTL